MTHPQNGESSTFEQAPEVPPRAAGSEFRARVIAAEGPAFGAYLAGTAKDGEAVIFLNLLACLAVDRDPRKTAAETLAHEVLHACQEIMGEALTESDINNAIARINGVELGSYEDEEEAMQAAAQDLQEAYTEIERLRDALSRIAHGQSCNGAKAARKIAATALADTQNSEHEPRPSNTTKLSP